MTAYEIIPFESVGGIRFGSIPDKVREHFGENFKSFKKTPQSVFPSDHFLDLGVLAYYDATGKLNAIEMTSPAHALWNGRDLSVLNFAELRAVLSIEDSSLQTDSDGLTAPSLGIGAWVPDAKEDKYAPCETIIAFVRGYYNKAG